MAEDYGGILGAYPYAFRQSRSWLFRSYVVASGVVGGFIAVLLLLGLITWLAGPTGLAGQNAFLGVIGILVIAPLAAPVLFVARRYRLETPRPEADRLFAIAGYLFLGSLYLALLITDPSQHTIGGPLQGLLATLDALPGTYGLILPVIAAVAILLVARLTRPTSTD
jgi:hypothetical protein